MRFTNTLLSFFWLLKKKTYGLLLFWKIGTTTTLGLSVLLFLLLTPSAYAQVIINNDSLQIPQAVRVDRDGRKPLPAVDRFFYVEDIAADTIKNVFDAPPCLEGQYYVGFQLYYDLGDYQTVQNWLCRLDIALLHGEDTLWTKPLQVEMEGQVFVATVFHDSLISCDGDYRFLIKSKNTSGGVIPAPEENILLRVLLYKNPENEFDPLSQLLLNCSYSNGTSTLSWTYASEAAEYDLEWVFISEHDNFTGTTSDSAFLFKEAVRVTVAQPYYTHLTYYPNGQLWYRARAIGYNPQYPDHRILGHWFNSPCGPILINNQEPQKNWQLQTVFAEEGKYKKIMQYYDGSLRQRQSQTNLSSNNTTLVGEMLYDYEGRKALDVLAVPVGATSLNYRAAFNVFQTTDPLVQANTSAIRKKFHYDNRRLDNSILSKTVGASQYYSDQNAISSMHKDFIPDAEGYAYSQTEYLNDGTGRIARQSGVGKEFRHEGPHATRYYYVGATRSELLRLFGTNVGNASHYKKNVVVDPNSQVSVSYLDQEGRVIATALAGEKPANVDSLDSYANLDPTPVTEHISDKNRLENGNSITHHSFVNVVANTEYTFRYDLSALASDIETFGCQQCSFDLKITLTNQEGSLVVLPENIPGNQSPDSLAYERNITAADCNTPAAINDIEFLVILSDIGDYTITKTLTPQELSFEQIKAIVEQDSLIQVGIQQIRESYAVDSANCEICTSCPEGEAAIEEAIDEIATLDCENIYRQIEQYYYDQHPTDPDYEPTTQEIESHALYCKYLVCSKDKESDAFEKRLARIPSWSVAASTGKNNPINEDPFFNNAALSGFNYKTAMQDMLNNVSLGVINGITYAGTISEVTDPENTEYYVDGEGNNDPVNGRHILYLDLMSRRAELGEITYQADIDKQRWVMYKNFYVEVKRQVKLSIPEYQNCGSLVNELNPYDGLASYAEQDVIDWGNANGWKDSVSVDELEMALYNITSACDTTLNYADSISVVGHLQTYFNSNPKNFLRIIFSEEVESHSDLIAIKNILDGYGCALSDLALDNPLTCAKDTVITIPEEILYMDDLIPITANKLLSSDVIAKNSPIPVSKLLNKKGIRNEILDSIRNESLRKSIADLRASEERIIEKIRKKQERAENLNSQLSNGRQSGSASILALPTQQEYDALMAFYTATGGPNWTNKTGWQDADPNVVEDVTGWYGVFTDFSGHVEGLQLYNNNLVGKLPAEIGNLAHAYFLSLSQNHLADTIPSEIGNLSDLISLTLSDNNFIGPIPEQITNLINLEYLDISVNQLSGAIPENIDNLAQLRYFNIGNNNLNGILPVSLGNLVNLTALIAVENDITGTIPREFGDLANLEYLLLQQNKLTDSIPSTLGNLLSLRSLGLFDNNLKGRIPNSLINLKDMDFGFMIDDNQFTYSDFLHIKQGFTGTGQILYSPQDSVDVTKNVGAAIGHPLTLTTDIDRNTNPLSKYQWFKYVNGVDDIPLIPQPTETGHSYVISNVTGSDIGSSYYYKITNPDALELTLISRLQTLQAVPMKSFTLCLEYDTANTTLEKFTYTVNWEQLVEQCLQRAAQEDSTLTEFAINSFLEEKVGIFNNEFRTKCLQGVIENLEYTYIPKEYHYTLYYYDQAANLVQTIPPKGVTPLTTLQVDNFDSSPVDPPHILTTRYQYNSLNQLVWQKTPDANESRFWYNDKGQLKLSQNAQQLLDTLYSYTKYDEQGRVIEVGEMGTAVVLNTLLDSLENINFPFQELPDYQLTDVTRTYYDFANQPLQSDFPQQNLRTRVAWVEVIDKNAIDTIATYYSYDIHGNVKSLVQQVPGLESKRTDYAYDLISGKVNYVMYQFDEPDQFIHQYEYDADNRITAVLTSTDGFIWDNDASYYYYAHGPLARVELGEHRVQGLDYYYTLQGWIKGVNQPYADDPDIENLLDYGAGKDVFSYALGYYQGDYKPVNANFTTPDERDNLWTRLNEVNNHIGLYNGNISWMITDLAKMGEINSDRTKGMQAMLYQYDQLHRITKSRSLTAYTANDGFAARITSPAPYDEDYSYDPNGNLLTLQRRDDQSNVLNDFNYMYFSGTNRLRQVEPPIDIVYNEGAIASNTQLYRKITIQGSAYVPQGKTVELRALEEIEMDPDFEAPDGTDFWAHIVADSGMYQYDAIGNLILDQYDGVKISWTPYGKVREVKTKSDSVTVSFRYDGTGNRVEKKVVKFDTTYVTTYVRDASGNVMTIYKNAILAEQPIYGSSRVGMYRGGRYNGSRNLGAKNYELSNHLGNVLAVITDNVEVNESDSVWANVVSTSDYYPFGLEMTRRTWSDTSSYRYGFNGKEKDDNGEFGDTHYDYGFRIYSPSIGRFLSVDPLAKSYPMLTPYQFASNMPIVAIDLDGLEAMIAIYGSGTTDGKSDEPQFKKEAAQDVANGIAKGQARGVFTADQFIDLLVTETKNEGSIGYIFISSHGSANGVFFDSRPGSGSALNISGEDWPDYGFTNKGITDISNNSDIAFDKNALCVFAGCNIGQTKLKGNPKAVVTPIASKFTEITGVPTIAAEGNTSPSGDKRLADSNYYLFENVNGKVIKTDIGKELTQDLIQQIYGYLKRQNNLENTPSTEVKKPDTSDLTNIPKPTLSIPANN